MILKSKDNQALNHSPIYYQKLFMEEDFSHFTLLT
jgi:hypothetical protein